MALVMLPCDLPWWTSVQNHLKKISNTKNTTELVEGMQKIHELCNVSLDPDEDMTDPQLFVGLLNFLDNDLSSEERSKFLSTTMPNIIKRALSLKEFKPKDGLHFSLQQQPDCIELDYNFVASLIANAFFSTFPKRTDKSHPTLQDFNFTNFFKYLPVNSQKSKFRSIMYYFDWLEEKENSNGSLKVLRQVMSSKEWLTIEDWLECSLPLCSLHIKHEGKMERTDSESLQICFSSTKIGRKVLSDGNSQESITLVTFPELLCILLNVEALEDNEVLTVERARNICKVSDPKKKATLEKIEHVKQRTICCMDAEDYAKLPLGQYEEDNILRELNKCLLAFQQKQSRKDGNTTILPNRQNHRQRRLSPIGESMGSNTSETANLPLITQQSCSTTKSRSPSPKCDAANKNLKVQKDHERAEKKVVATEGVFNNRRGRFIVLGSSGECLPVKRKPESSTSLYSSVDSSEEEFHSAKTSIDKDSEEELDEQRYNIDLETPERRFTFAQRLRDALRRETSSATTVSEDSSYAVGILVAGSGLGDQDIKLLDLKSNISSTSTSDESSSTVEVTLSSSRTENCDKLEEHLKLDRIEVNISSQSEISMATSLPSDAFENLLDNYRLGPMAQLDLQAYKLPERQELIEKYHQFLQPSTSNSSSSFNSEEVSSEGDVSIGDEQQLKRGGSRGFMLNEDSFHEEMLEQEKQWVDKFKSKQPNIIKKGSHRSSDYSFSTEYSSELEEVYEQFSKWLQDPILETDSGTKRKRELDSRDLAVVQFAGSLLKRALSESFAGVPLTNGCENATEGDITGTKKNKLVLNAKSLSLELARHKHRLAAQLNEPNAAKPEVPENPSVNALDRQDKSKKSKLRSLHISYRSQVIQTLEDESVNVNVPDHKLSQLSQPQKNGVKPVTTGNWGCGQSKQGEVQLKVIIQWLAASVAGVPTLIYYTCGHSDLVMLDTVYRILRDRKWTVKDLAEATLRFSHQVLHAKNVSATLFEDLIGVERTT